MTYHSRPPLGRLKTVALKTNISMICSGPSAYFFLNYYADANINANTPCSRMLQQCASSATNTLKTVVYTKNRRTGSAPIMALTLRLCTQVNIFSILELASMLSIRRFFLYSEPAASNVGCFEVLLRRKNQSAWKE